MAFEDDIKGQNTQLYPVVRIGNDIFDNEAPNVGHFHYYSTNNVSLTEQWGFATAGRSVYCKPILMNIPSIKESIDIESRKFKISNVTLDFNNFPFEGERFSDQLSETSLMNTEVSIYFKSPSTHQIPTGGMNIFYDVDNVNQPEKNFLFKVYEGIIRRITHDDTKVTIQLEDLTEKEAHRDLPQAYTPDAEYVSDKYKNKPIPIVYGHVDKSPTIIHTSKIVPDARLIDKYNDNPLYIDLDGTYAGVPKQIIENFGDAYVEVDDEEQVVVYSENDTQFVEEDSLLQNIFSRVLDLSQNPLLEANLIQITEKNKKPEGFGVSTHTDFADLNALDTLSDSEMQLVTDGNSATFVENTHSNDIDYGVNNIFYKHKMFGGESRIDFFSREDKISKNAIFFLNGFRVNFILGLAYRNLESFTNNSIYDYDAEYTDVEGNDNLGLFTYNIDEYNNGHRDFYFNIQNIVLAEDPSTTYNLTDYDFVTLPLFYVISSNSGLLTLRPYFLDDVAYNQANLEYSLRIRDIYREDWGNIKNPLKNNFYVDINGRINTLEHPYLNSEDLIENPIDIIYDLVRTELGHDAIDEDDYLEARTEHSDWKFAFTLDKKMNSKKLIEDIAKSTKCFPKFKNNGKFGFNTIKEAYSVEDYENAKEIVYSDIISYTYKKTKPEQIYRKVDVQYNMDYAQDSLLSRTQTLNLGSSEFYGIESSDDAYLEFESPYIRDEHTADRLNFFLTQQYKDDHLILNIKLPLQYIDLEIGKLVKLRQLDVKPYGADIRVLETINDSIRYPLFMITSIAKNLDSIQIECMQLHYISIYYSGTFDTNWMFETLAGGLFNFPDADPLTITPFIPESEELLGLNLWTNPDFTDSSFSAIQIDVVDDEIVIDGGSFNLYGSEILSADDPDNILEEGKVYRYEFEITESTTTASFFGIKVFPEQSGSSYVNEVGVYSFDLEKQTYGAQNLNVLRLLFYGFRGKIKNNISVREVIQEATPFDGGFSPNIDSENWTTQTQWTISNNIATYDATVNSKNMSATLLNGHTVNVGEIYEITFTISNVQSGKKAVIAFWNEQTANPYTVGATAYDNGTHTVTGQVRTATSVNQSNKITLVGYTSLNGGSFSISNLSYKKIEASATTFKFRFSDVLQQQEFYKIDNKLNLKDLKDME